MNEKFIEAVKAGKIEELLFHDDVLYGGSRSLGLRELSGTWCWYDAPMGIDFLCAHLRRWLVAQGYDVILNAGKDLSILHLDWDDADPDSGYGYFREGTELDWHIAAALDVLEAQK